MNTKIYEFEDFELMLLQLGYEHNVIWDFCEYYQNLLPFEKNLASFKAFLKS